MLAPKDYTHLFELSFGAREVTIFSKRGSPAERVQLVPHLSIFRNQLKPAC